VAKLPDLEHVKYVRSKGRLYAYFNTGKKQAGRAIYARLPDPSSPSFFASYAAFKAGRDRRDTPGYLVRNLIDDYTRSPDFVRRSPATRRNYHLQLGKVVEYLGRFPVDDLKPGDIRDVLDAKAWGAATQNLFVAVIGTAYRWGRQRGKTESEPAKDIGKLVTGQHEPWPESVLGAALASDNARIRLAVHLLYYTGQRIGDVCALRWGDIRGGEWRIIQQKTGKALQFPVYSALQAVLDETPRRSITILTGQNGRAISPVTIRQELVAFTAAQGRKCVPHGLRKNAVNALLEEGCTIAEVAAITGQSFGVVEHYAARVNQTKLGRAAMLKFERRAVE
jgi:integrase